MLILLNCRVRLAPNVWVVFGFVFSFLFLVCGGAKKGCELLRDIDEAYCNHTACNSFIPSLVCWCHSDPKVSTFFFNHFY